MKTKTNSAEKMSLKARAQRFALTARLITAALACTSVLTAGSNALAQTSPLPDSMKTFDGIVEGTVKWKHGSTWWMVMNLERAVTVDGRVIPPAQLAGLDFRMTIRWNGPNIPQPATHDIVKNAKDGERLQLRVKAKGNDLQIQGAATADAINSATRRPAFDHGRWVHPEDTFIPGQPMQTRPEIVTGAVIDETIVARVIHVHPNGDDAGQGAAGQPVRTLERAFAMAKTSLREGVPTKISIAAGVYREGGFSIDGEAIGGRARETLLVIEGEGDRTIISGADPITSAWRPVDGVPGVYQTEWKHSFGNRPTPMGNHNPRHVLGHRVEQLFVNGVPMRQVLIETYDYTMGKEWGQVGTHSYRGNLGPSALTEPGTFGITERPENGGMLYVRPLEGTVPTDAEVETAVRDWFLRFDKKENIVVRNLTIQRHNNKLHLDSVLRLGGMYGTPFLIQNALLENLRLLWNNGTACDIRGAHALTVRNCVSNYNGGSGMGPADLNNVIWQDVTTNFNNWRGHMGGKHSWVFGGVKFGPTHNAVIRRHTAIGNLSAGFWMDINPKNVTIEEVVSVANIQGIFLEGMGGPTRLSSSLAAHNFDNDLLINTSPNVTVENCIFFGGKQMVVKAINYRREFNERVYPKIQGDSTKGRVGPLMPGPVLIRDSVIATETQPAQALLAWENRFGTQFARQRSFGWQGYAAQNNLMHGPNTTSFRWVNPQFQVELTEFDALIARSGTSEGHTWSAPGFVAPEKWDFRLRADSPLQARAALLPAKALDPDLQKATEAFHQWARFRMQEVTEVGR